MTELDGEDSEEWPMAYVALGATRRKSKVK